MSPEEMQLDMLVAELDRENRLLRARNDRLEAESECMAKELERLRGVCREIEDPCPGCLKGRVCRTPKCGRLNLPENHPYRVGN
jgi:hypothetical protein